MVDWPTPRDRTNLRGFLGLIGLHTKFIKSFSKISTLLTELLKGNVEIKWTPMCEDNFCKLKRAFTLASILKLMDYTKGELVLCTDASEETIGTVLM